MKKKRLSRKRRWGKKEKKAWKIIFNTEDIHYMYLTHFFCYQTHIKLLKLHKTPINLPVTSVRAHRQANAEMSMSMACREWQNSRMACNQSPKLRWHCCLSSTTPLQNVSFVSSGLVLYRKKKQKKHSCKVERNFKVRKSDYCNRKISFKVNCFGALK